MTSDNVSALLNLADVRPRLSAVVARDPRMGRPTDSEVASGSVWRLKNGKVGVLMR